MSTTIGCFRFKKRQTFMEIQIAKKSGKPIEFALSLLSYFLRDKKNFFVFPSPLRQVLQGSLFSNIVTDVRNNRCDDIYVYMSDVLRYGLVVYNLKEDKSWRISHNFFYPDPIACRYTLDNTTFRFANWKILIKIFFLFEI